MKYDKYDRLIRKYSDYELYSKDNATLTIIGDYLELIEGVNLLHLIHKRNIHSISVLNYDKKLIHLGFKLDMGNYSEGINLEYTDKLFRDITEWLSL